MRITESKKSDLSKKIWLKQKEVEKNLCFFLFFLYLCAINSILRMKAKDFFGKFCSKFLLGHLLAMLLVVIALVIGVKYGLDWYTHHGEGIEVAKVEGMLYKDAYSLMTEDGLNIVVSDSGYNKQLPADCILSQNPGPGTKVKSGHTAYVTG